MSGATASTVRWQATGRSVRGAAHRRRGAPNQDAILWWPTGAGDATAVLAVADGHGSAGCPRSGAGARLAVETAVDVLRLLLDEAGADRWQALERDRCGLPVVLADLWREAVADHAERHPWGALETDPPDRNGVWPPPTGPFSCPTAPR